MSEELESTAMKQHMGELKGDISKLRSDIGNIVRTIMEAGKSEAGDAREKLEQKAREQLENLTRGLNYTRERGSLAANKVCGQIEDHPVASVLSALGVGVLIGMIVRRK